MLFGEDFSGRHHRRLTAGVDRGEAADRSDDSLAAADVALQQPLHRMRLREIAQDFRHGASLRARQAERQLAEEALEQRPVRGQGNRVPAAARAVRHAHRQLLREQFVKLDAPPCLAGALGEFRRRSVRRRPVQGTNALGDAGKRIAPPQRFGQGVLQHRFIERLEHELAQRVLRQTGGGRINRRQCLRERLSGRNDAGARMHHLGAEKPRTNLAVGAHQQAFVRRALKCFQLAAVEVQEPQHQALGMDHQLALGPVGDIRTLNARFDQHRLAGGCEFRRGKPGFILVAVRKMQGEVIRRTQAELGELFCDHRRGFALQPAYRMQSISTSAPRGRLATPTAAREGYGWPTYCAMISFTVAKCPRSVR